jgi:S1/P1 Nuclease
MGRRFAVLALGLWALSNCPALAWFKFGHMEIAALAWSKLTPTEQASAARLLKRNPMYPIWVNGVADADRDQTAFIKAAVWADDIKEAANYFSDGPDGGNRPPPGPEASQNIGYADHFMHKYWHFIDLPFSPDGTLLTQPEKPNAQTQIAAFRATLSDPTASDDVKSYDLVWLLHLVGDVHQPLHATSRFTQAHPKGDAGGNFVNVQCGSVCNQPKLHFVWDDLLGPGDTPQEAAAAAMLLPEADPKLAMIADESAWIHESFEAAQAFAYAPPIGTGPGTFPITDTYESAALSVAKQRAALAGVRMANLLKAALK